MQSNSSNLQMTEASLIVQAAVNYLELPGTEGNKNKFKISKKGNRDKWMIIKTLWNNQYAPPFGSH